MTTETKTHVVMLGDGSLFQYGTNRQTMMEDNKPVEWLGRQIAGIRRFQGATTHGISVAAHSVLAYETALTYLGVAPGSRPTAPNIIEALLATLLHDARECATGDIAGPFLNYWREKHPESYAAVLETESSRFEMTLLMFLDLPLDLFEKHKMLVGYVDKQAMLMEVAFMPPSKHFAFPPPDDIDQLHCANAAVGATKRGEDEYQFTRILTDLLAAYRRATKADGIASSIDHVDDGTDLAKPAAKKFRASYLDRNDLFKLHNAVREIYAAYGRHNNCGVYLVGSCLERADYRDVDVRCILGDEAFENLFPKDSNGQRPLWRLTCISLSTWLKEVTGLPIDFQFQKHSVANAKHRGPRNGLGTYHWSGDGAD